ncbi:12-(S)-hydroxy-5,8,10,14-eicosatetraenoic acid receptor-like [Clytia hemisphaerica]|uniref:G-protein coupled receptors family 1 profile domain-containing protein n=1 Tax=Clytia hemisphaerica TaxID=252671 RepID=A0A7M5U8J9_9CNID
MSNTTSDLLFNLRKVNSTTVVPPALDSNLVDNSVKDSTILSLLSSLHSTITTTLEKLPPLQSTISTANSRAKETMNKIANETISTTGILYTTMGPSSTLSDRMLKSTVENTISTVKSLADAPNTTRNGSFSSRGNSNFPKTSVMELEIHLSPIELFTATMLVMLFVIGTVGNLLTLWVFLVKKKRNRKRFELLLSGLAVTDLFSSITVPSLFLYGTLTQFKRWDFGHFGCKFISSLFPASVTLSQGILILISYDRYRSMSSPFGQRISRTFIGSWIVASILIACALVSPYYYALELVRSPEYGIDTCIPTPYKFKQVFIYSVGNIVRDFVATIALVILGVMTNKSLKVGALLGGVKAFKKRQENANKARKMLIVVACVFSFCVIPLDLFQVIVYSLVKMKVKISVGTYEDILKGNTFLLILQIANSSTNFIIYSQMNRSFMRHLFSCIRKGKHFTASFRATFRSTRTESMDSLTTKSAVILAVLPLTPDSDNVFLQNSTDGSQDSQFLFPPEPNNNVRKQKPTYKRTLLASRSRHLSGNFI